MNLRSFDTAALSQSGVEYKVRHPVTGEVMLDENSKPMVLKLLGPDSKEFRRISQTQVNASLRQQFDLRGRKNLSADKLTAQAIEEYDIQLCTTCTVGWDNVCDGEDNHPLEFNKDNVEKVYKSFPFLREQVSMFINDRANFMQDSKKN